VPGVRVCGNVRQLPRFDDVSSEQETSPVSLLRTGTPPGPAVPAVRRLRYSAARRRHAAG
jgi:hypothetical protein